MPTDIPTQVKDQTLKKFTDLLEGLEIEVENGELIKFELNSTVDFSEKKAKKTIADMKKSRFNRKYNIDE